MPLHQQKPTIKKCYPFQTIACVNKCLRLRSGITPRCACIVMKACTAILFPLLELWTSFHPTQPAGCPDPVCKPQNYANPLHISTACFPDPVCTNPNLPWTWHPPCIYHCPYHPAVHTTVPDGNTRSMHAYIKTNEMRGSRHRISTGWWLHSYNRPNLHPPARL